MSNLAEIQMLISSEKNRESKLYIIHIPFNYLTKKKGFSRAEHNIVISLLATVTALRYSLSLHVSNDHVLESTNNDVTSNDIYLRCNRCTLFEVNSKKLRANKSAPVLPTILKYFVLNLSQKFGRWEKNRSNGGIFNCNDR